MAEFDDLSTALAAVRTNYDALVAAIQDGPRGAQIKDGLARAILHEMQPIAEDVQGSDWDYHITVLGGSRTVLHLQAGYPELSEL